MRFGFKSAAAACCVSISAVLAAGAQEGDAGAACADKPNLTGLAPALSNVFAMTGLDQNSVADDVLMVDFIVVMKNDGGVAAEGSRLSYTAQVRSLAGAVVETVDGVTDTYWIAPGETQENIVNIVVSELAPLLQPSGEVKGAIRFRAVADVDNDVAECVETDNSGEATVELSAQVIDPPQAS
ncbi:hypothetical protein [Amphiplicatus metriothermophilus]|uniref:Uncharacterized protein n=1 Tax=Amphiplicatus metriothermophilus TaxID=1519374 RepID=A0A239PTL7_9PROT|nr:hypothetical protein [Amphiplicatus metriothermophilus]MBB5519203.1 hypothetical protein [Amphiplicatus metriothermophilus]SNT73272.1 hypothetical protein SAMN06297382_1670 [Amphiplicatus metriothermophilus]